jgi:hypothetical protein
MLDDRGAAFNPVARVDVGDPVEIAQRRVVDVAADHAVAFQALGFLGQRLLEMADEADGILDLELGPGRERPVGQAEAPAHHVEPGVDAERGDIGPVAQKGQPFGMAHHHVEGISMHDEVALAVRCDMHGLLHHLDAAEVVTGKIAQEFVVIAGDVDHARALAGLAQELLHHVIVGLRPIPAAFQLPGIDDVANQIDGLGIVVTKKVEQHARLTSARAQMYVRNKERPIARAFAIVVHGTVSALRPMLVTNTIQFSIL